MKPVSAGKLQSQRIAAAIGSVCLGELILRDVYFERAGEDVEIPYSNPYRGDPIPTGYRSKTITGDRRGIVRKGATSWTTTTVYFISDTAGITADIVLTW